VAARVMVFAAIDAAHAQEFETAYTRVAEVIRGTPGHVRDELLRDAERPGHYVVFSEWESLEAFRAWEDAPHHELTTPMRPFWFGRTERVIYDVAVAPVDGTDVGWSTDARPRTRRFETKS
jgi:heme-degrading monooxygenase HmoA